MWNYSGCLSLTSCQQLLWNKSCIGTRLSKRALFIFRLLLVLNLAPFFFYLLWLSAVVLTCSNNYVERNCLNKDLQPAITCWIRCYYDHHIFVTRIVWNCKNKREILHMLLFCSVMPKWVRLLRGKIEGQRDHYVRKYLSNCNVNYNNLRFVVFVPL